MKNLSAGLLLLLGLACPALAQQVVNPNPNAGAYGAYNSGAQTCITGTGCWLQTDVNGNLKVTGTVTSSIAGTTSNASSGVATSATNIPAVSYNYGFNGTTWDQLQVDATKNLKTVLSSQYPSGAVALTGNSTGTTGAVVGTLTAAATSTTAYICGFAVSATGGVATIGPITIAGLTGSSMVFQLFSTATGANLVIPFNPCIPASAVNTNITVTTTADATASAVDVNSWGYRF